MSAGVLLNQVVARIRGQFTRRDVLTLEPYGGQFSTEEIDFTSYACPAVFVTVLGWKPANGGTRLTGPNVSRVHMGAFVVCKHAERSKRMAEAMLLSERLGVCLRQWTPMREPANANLPVTIAGLEEDAAAENLYGRAIDKVGQALWLVDWHQCVRPERPLAEMWDLLSIDIHDRALAGAVDDTTSAGTVPIVTEQIDFQQQN